MILYIENPKDATRKLELINVFGKVAGYKINTQKSVALTMKAQREKLNNFISHHIKKNKILGDKPT